MAPNGTKMLDGIGATFPEVKNAIAHTSSHGTPVDYDVLSSLEMNKTCLYFVHDLVLFAGPISHEEIILILKAIFGKKGFDTVKSLLGVLRESQLVTVQQIDEKTRVYKASSTDSFLQYRTDTYALMSAFRVYHLKFHPERLQHG